MDMEEEIMLYNGKSLGHKSDYSDTGLLKILSA